MYKKIYVGNLPFSASDREVRELFSDFGHVETVDLVTDRDTGRPKGFGFVEMSSGAEEAIEALNLKYRDGRILTVNEIRPRESPGGRARRW